MQRTLPNWAGIDGAVEYGGRAALGAAFPDVPVVLEPVDSWADLLEAYYANPADWAFAFALKVLLDFRRAPETCFVERSPQATRHVFAQMNYNDGSMNAHQWDLFKDYHDELAWTPDVVFFIDTPAAECMNRARRRGRTAPWRGDYGSRPAPQLIRKPCTGVRLNVLG